MVQIPLLPHHAADQSTKLTVSREHYPTIIVGCASSPLSYLISSRLVVFLNLDCILTQKNWPSDLI